MSDETFKQHACHLEETAKTVRQDYSALTLTARRKIGQRTRRLAFSSFEAGRQELREKRGTMDVWFYRVFLIGTCTSPLLIMLLPATTRQIGWDLVGIVSTFVLLLWTYGLYCLSIIRGLSSILFETLREIVSPSRADAEVSEASEYLEVDGNVAFANLLLLLLGATCAIYALYTLVIMYAEESREILDRMAFNRDYCRFFVAVYLLSILFIIMDIVVAKFDRSHSESFIASSSAVHATVPMCIALNIMGAYLLFEYLEGHLLLGLDSAASYEKLSVSFVSGALSFQMLISNILFIFIKKNLIFRVVYATIDRSVLD